MDPWQDIRRRARETRALLGVGYAGAPAQTVLDALLRHWDIALDLVAPEHPLLRGARAAWREEYGLVIVDGTLSPAERSFAVAHELGHRVCHPGGCLCEPADIDDEALPVALPLGEGRVWGYNPRQAREVEANVFAAELLAPAAGLRALFLAGSDYRTLADHYGVTATCALNGLAGAVLGGEPSPPASLPRLPRAGGVGEKSSPMYKDGPGLGEGLDESQRRAAETGAARALIDAGPGTGKTRTLVARVLRLLQTAGVPAHEILALTFSNRATDELRERLRAAGPETAGVVVSTFHGYALDALRRFAPQAGLPDGFRVVDDVDAAIMMEEAIPALDLKRYTHLARPALYLPAILQAAGRMRDLLLTREDLALVTRDTDAEEQEQEQEQGQGQGQERGDRDEDERAALDETLRLLASYDELLAARGLVDYGGLIARAVDLMQSSPAAAASLRGGIRHVLVDEYQDVNRASAVLLRELVAGGAHLWAVGDARQSIYRFRGAEPRNLADFEKDFPGGVRLSLERNYRATPALVDAIATVAARITGSRPAWQAWRDGAVDAAGYPGDGEVTLAVAPDGASEVAGIVDDIARSIATGRPPDEHAVLCRTHRQATNVAAALEAAGLPTSYLGSLFLRPEIKDLLAFLELCHGLDGSALLRLAMWPEYRLDRGRVVELVGAARERGAPFPAALGEAGVTSGLTVEERGRLGRLAAHVEAARYYPDPASVLLHYLFSDAPYLRRLLRDDSPSARQAAAAIFQLIVLARGFMARPLAGPADGATHAFLRYARRLLAEGEAAVSQAAAAVPGAVNLLTVHASKGLEFPVVYMPNLAQGRFPPRARGGVQVALPAALARDPRADAEEEHNLFFVAVSRARDRLVLSRAERYGGRAARESDLLGAIRGAAALREVTWPVVAADGDAAETPEAGRLDGWREGAGAATSRDIAVMLRCPSLHYYRGAGLRGDDDPRGYRLFAQLLRDGIATLRASRGGVAWPASPDEAEKQFADRWEGRWPDGDALAAWYGAVARRALRRVYHDIARQGNTLEGQYAREQAVDLDGRRVSVTIDAVEEIDGVTHVILERATRRNDDATGTAVALYAAAARALTTAGAEPPVLIRYLDSGETRAVPDPGRVLTKHGPRLRTALDQLKRGEYPSAPHDDAECTRCPLVFVCPR